MSKQFYTFLLVLALPLLSKSQYLGGYFTYLRTGALDYTVTLTTFTVFDSSSAFCSVPIEVVDGSGTVVLHRDTLHRVNGSLGACDSLAGSGESMSSGILKNVYRFTYSFPSFDNYAIRFQASGFDSSIVNLGSNQPFHLNLNLALHPFIASDEGPKFSVDSTPVVCLEEDLVFDCGWNDPDGDSLVFTSIVPPGVTGYSFPWVFSDTFWVERIDGLIHFLQPHTEGLMLYGVRYSNYRSGIQVASSDVFGCLLVQSCALGQTISLDDARWVLIPNPTSSGFQIRMSNVKSGTELRVLDSWGHEVLAQNAYTGNMVDMNGLPPGIYFVHVFSNQGRRTFKIVKV
jgi:hypothetical protein